MKSKSKTFLIILLIIIPTLIMSVGIFFFAGMKKLGTPSEYNTKLKNKNAASQDSILVAKGIVPTSNKADSVMTGLAGHEAILDESNKQEKQLNMIKNSPDSLKVEKSEIEKKKKSIEEIKTAIDSYGTKATNEKITSLAKIYDSMKVKQLVPLIQSCDDTLAVLVMSKMQKRNAG
jgi:flagellar motility protein MotE (MotC chaperone)